MKWEQYQQLQAAARKHIAKRIESIQPRAGNNVSVVVDGIAIEAIQRQPQREKPPETWTYYLLGSIIRDGNVSIYGDTLAEAARMLRPSGVIQKTSFWENTQLNGLPDATSNKIKKVSLSVTTLTPPQTADDYQNGVYRGGLKVGLVMYHIEAGVRVIDNRYTFNVGLSGDERTFTPPGEDIYFLDIVSVERL